MRHTPQNCKYKEMDCLWQTWAHHSSLPGEEQKQVVMEQTPATTGSTPTVKDTRLGGRRSSNALQHFCLICLQSEALDDGASDQRYADPEGV